MDNASKLLAEFRSRVRKLTEGIDGSQEADIVDVGTALAAIVTTATDALKGIKEDLRDRARSSLGHQPGSVAFEGLDIGQVAIVVPSPKVQLVKAADPDMLKIVLGDDFDTFFDTKVKYTPKKDATTLVVDLPAGQAKDLLLYSLEEAEQTPRVSFRKV